VPFRAAIEANAAFIMTAHVLVTSIDDERPATLSRRIVYDLLRDELGFRGVILSDDLEMKAIADRYSPAEAAVAAIGAGCDALLMCGKGGTVDIGLQVGALEGLIRAVEEERLPAKRVEDALARNTAAKERFAKRGWLPPAPGQLNRIIGCEAHQLVAHEMSAFA
jgi:beta-N-acetylhexosaminidase